MTAHALTRMEKLHGRMYHAELTDKKSAKNLPQASITVNIRFDFALMSEFRVS